MASDAAAKELLGFAKNRLNKSGTLLHTHKVDAMVLVLSVPLFA